MPVEVPQSIDKVVDIPVVAKRQIPMVQEEWKSKCKKHFLGDLHDSSLKRIAEGRYAGKKRTAEGNHHLGPSQS